MTLTTKTTAAEFKQIASSLNITLEGNARLKATKQLWIAQIEFVTTGAIAPTTSTAATATTYVTVEQASKAAKIQGYTIKVNHEIMKIHIQDNKGQILATVWLTSDVLRWLKTAPNLEIEVETTDDFIEVEKPSEVLKVVEAIKAIAIVAESTISPEPVIAPKAPKTPKIDKETARAENESRASEIRETLEMMGSSLAFEVINWVTFQAKIYQGKKVLGFVGVNMLTGKPWFRPLASKISKSIQFPVETLSSAVSKVILWHVQEQQESA